MKNKLYICEHNVVISPKNQCIDCNYEELRDRMIKGGIFVDDNKQKIEQQSLKRKPKIVSDMLIESLIETNNEFRMENIKLGEHNTQLEVEINGLKKEVDSLQNINIDHHKKGASYEKEIDKLNTYIQELEGFHNKLFQLTLYLT